MRGLIFALLPSAALAGPVFEPVSVPEHIYSGGWEHFVGGGVAAFDCDGDGLQDLYLAGGAGPAQLLRNGSTEDEISFEKVALDPIESVTGAYPIDIDADGHMDLAVLRVGENLLLKGDGTCRFTRANELWGFDGGDAWSTAFSATWEKGQSRPTLAIGNYVDRDDPQGPFEACDINTLHRPVEDGYQKTVLAPGFCTLSMLFSDWNRTGTADLRVSNDRHYYVRGGSEQMWAMPELRLRDGEGWDPISIWGMGIASQDITGDGRPEVVLTSMGDQLMQIAGEAGYTAAPFEIGTYAQRPYIGDDGRPSTGWHAEFGDVNNDGRSDLFIAKGNVDQMPGLAMKDPNNLLLQGSDGRFEEWGDRAGVASVWRARGGALADLDRDGLLDLVVVNRRAPLEIYHNVTQETGNWVGFELIQEGGNRNAIGAWAELRVDGVVQTQEVTIGGGHVSGELGALHFGVAAAETAEFRVIWPDGTVGPWDNVTINTYQEVTRN